MMRGDIKEMKISGLDDLEQSLGPAAFQDLVEGVRREAEHAANQTADRLDQFYADRGRERKKGRPLSAEPASFTLFLTAALRRKQWCEEGYERYIGTQEREIAMAGTMIKSFSNDKFGETAADRCRKFAADTLACWMQKFSWSARRLLGADVVLGGVDAITDQELEGLANFLFSHRACGKQSDGGNHVGT